MVRMSLSEMTPKARNRMNRGTGFRTLGTATTMFSLENLPEMPRPMANPAGAMIFIESVRIGFDTFSETERMVAEARKSPVSFLTSSKLSANFSWGISAFSFPSIMKYPPKSLRHSPIWKRSSGVIPVRIQKSDWTITGKRPRKTFSRTIDVI